MTKASGGTDWQRSIVLLSGTVDRCRPVTVLYWAQSIFIPVCARGLPDVPLESPRRQAPARGVARTPGRDPHCFPRRLLLGSAGWVVTAQISACCASCPSTRRRSRPRSSRSRSYARLEPRRPDVRRNQSRDRRVDRPPIRRARGRRETAPVTEERADPERPQAVIVEPQGPVWLADLALPIPLARISGGARPGDHPGDLHAPEAGRVPQPHDPVSRARARRRRHQVRRRGRSSHQPIPAHAGDRQWLVRAHPRGWLLCSGGQVRDPLGLPGAMLRYLPYIGPTIRRRAAGDGALAFNEGWTTTLMVIGLFVILELVVANFIEPWLYGQSMGVSESPSWFRPRSGRFSGGRSAWSFRARSRSAWSCWAATCPARVSGRAARG